MDFNDVSFRLKRVYNSIDKQFEKDIRDQINVKEVKPGASMITFGHYNKVELSDRVLGIISAIAGLKDHLKRRMRDKGKSPQVVEDMINNSETLCLVIDLWNQDKHGYPLKENKKRSYKDPIIKNLRQVMHYKSSKSTGPSYFRIEPNLARITIKNPSNFAVFIEGDVVDGEGNRIMPINKLISDSISLIEKFIKDNNLI